MFNNVTNQMSGLGSSLGGWFKKEEGAGNKADENSSATAAPAETTPQETPVPAPAAATTEKAPKTEDNDDNASQHSGATEGADSHPDSEVEEEGKAGFASGLKDSAGLSFNLSGVSSRASAGAKTVGSFFSTAFSKAGASVKEASSKIQGVVEKSPILSEFNKEQDAFIKAKGGKVGEALPPWVGYPEEEKLKEEIMSLSTERRNFVRSPPTGVSFEFELEQFLPVAQATLAVDSNLEKMRYELVPKTVNEETFWRNYFYRVGLIRQSTELSSLEKEGTQDAESSEKTENEANKG